MSEQHKGLVYGLAAYVMWGLFPLYWRLLAAASALEILAHRIVWSLLFVGALVGARRRLAGLRALVTEGRRVALLASAGLLLAINWGIYIHGVNTERVVETSLGYFINPLVTVLLGVLVLHERLRPAQWLAIGIGAAAVAVLTFDYGRLPTIALVLAISFALYGLAKKRADVGPFESLTVETALLAAPAGGYLVWLGVTGRATFGAVGPAHACLLVLAGAVTAIPLLCFGAAAIRVPLSTIGLLQYVAPALQFAIGVALFREPMPPVRVVGFALVWVALLLLTVDGLRARWRTGASAPLGAAATTRRAGLL